MFTSDFFKQIVMSTARHGLTTVAGMLVSEGIITGSQTNDFLGAGLFVVGIGWSWWQKHNQEKKIVAASQ